MSKRNELLNNQKILKIQLLHFKSGTWAQNMHHHYLSSSSSQYLFSETRLWRQKC